MEDPDDKMIWDGLHGQAEANLRQAEANLRQPGANDGTSSAIKLLTQRLLCKESAPALEPDRLEAWFAANGDAEAITSFAGQIAQQADSNWLGTVGGREGRPNNPPLVDMQAGKHVMGTKSRAPSVLDLLIKESPGGAGTDVAISLEADTTDVVDGDGLVVGTTGQADGRVVAVGCGSVGFEEAPGGRPRPPEGHGQHATKDEGSLLQWKKLSAVMVTM